MSELYDCWSDPQHPERQVLPTLPRVRVSTLVGGVKVKLLESEEQDGNISLAELEIISTLVAVKKPKLLFEIGTFDGRTTVNLAANAGRNSHVYTLDLPRDALNKTSLAIVPGDKKYILKKRSGERFLLGGREYCVVRVSTRTRR